MYNFSEDFISIYYKCLFVVAAIFYFAGCADKPESSVGTCFTDKESKLNYKVVGINKDSYSYKTCQVGSGNSCFENQIIQEIRFSALDENKSLLKVECGDVN